MCNVVVRTANDSQCGEGEASCPFVQETRDARRFTLDVGGLELCQKRRNQLSGITDKYQNVSRTYSGLNETATRPCNRLRFICRVPKPPPVHDTGLWWAGLVIEGTERLGYA